MGRLINKQGRASHLIDRCDVIPQNQWQNEVLTWASSRNLVILTRPRSVSRQRKRCLQRRSPAASTRSPRKRNRRRDKRIYKIHTRNIKIQKSERRSRSLFCIFTKILLLCRSRRTALTSRCTCRNRQIHIDSRCGCWNYDSSPVMIIPVAKDYEDYDDNDKQYCICS